MAKKKIYEYPVSATVKDKDGNVVLRIITQLYQVGIYAAEYHGNNSMPNQFNFRPKEVTKYMAQFKKDNLKEGYTSEFGLTKAVIEDEDGLLKETEPMTLKRR